VSAYGDWAARRSLSPVYAAQLTVARKSDGQEMEL